MPTRNAATAEIGLHTGTYIQIPIVRVGIYLKSITNQCDSKKLDKRVDSAHSGIIQNKMIFFPFTKNQPFRVSSQFSLPKSDSSSFITKKNVCRASISLQMKYVPVGINRHCYLPGSEGDTDRQIKMDKTSFVQPQFLFADCQQWLLVSEDHSR